MNRIVIITATIAIAGPCGDALASAQSLADLARAEEARRAAITRPARVFTNADTERFAVLERAANPAKAVAHLIPDSERLSAEAPAPLADASFDDRDAPYWSARRETVAAKRDQVQSDVDALRANLNGSGGTPPAPTEAALIRAVLVRAEADLRALQDEHLAISNDERASVGRSKRSK
jgi:hypothetical protein